MLYVIMQNGRPYELHESDAEILNRLEDHKDGQDAKFAFASTNRKHVEALMAVMPDLLDADDDLGLTIATYELT